MSLEKPLNLSRWGWGGDYYSLITWLLKNTFQVVTRMTNKRGIYKHLFEFFVDFFYHRQCSLLPGVTIH